jgi:hypothetical protein
VQGTVPGTVQGTVPGTVQGTVPGMLQANAKETVQKRTLFNRLLGRNPGRPPITTLKQPQINLNSEVRKQKAIRNNIERKAKAQAQAQAQAQAMADQVLLQVQGYKLKEAQARADEFRILKEAQAEAKRNRLRKKQETLNQLKTQKVHSILTGINMNKLTQGTHPFPPSKLETIVPLTQNPSLNGLSYPKLKELYDMYTKKAILARTKKNSIAYKQMKNLADKVSSKILSTSNNISRPGTPPQNTLRTPPKNPVDEYV